MKKPFVALLVIVTALPVLAQTESSLSLTADRQELTVGDPVVLTVNVTHPAGDRVLLPEFDSTWGDFEVRHVSLPQIATHAGGMETTTFTIEVTSFRPGQFSTPPQTVDVFDTNGGKTQLTGDPVVLAVNSVLVAGDTTLRDIKGQAELSIPEPASPVPLLALGVVLIAGLAAGTIYFLRRRPKPVVVDTRSPYQVAIDELQRIQTLDLPSKGEVDT